MFMEESLQPERPDSGKDPFAELKTRIHLAVIGDLGPQLYNVQTNPAELRERVVGDIRTHLASESDISRDDRMRLEEEIADDILGHGPLERLLADNSITEVMVNGPYDVWVERLGCLWQTPVRFNDDSHLRRIITKMVALAGRCIDESSPMLDAVLPDGSRINVILPPLTQRGPVLTIRKPARQLSLDDMTRVGTLSADTVDFLQRCVQAKLNILVSGAPRSGRTTLLNALAAAVPDQERIITVEESPELRLQQPHVIPLLAPRGGSAGLAVSLADLVDNAQHMRPDRIILSELNGAEAAALLKTIDRSDDGALTTIRANSPRDALARMETMLRTSSPDTPAPAIRTKMSQALDLIVQLERFEDGSRHVTAVTEVQGVESEMITVQDLFEWHLQEVSRDGVIVGALRGTGLRPTFLRKFEKHGIALPLNLFRPAPPNTPPQPSEGTGVREPRRPIKPTLSGNVALDPEAVEDPASDDGRT
jgi:pilus assembly protein CpaF